jgi:ATP-dependent RNA circularization protein (DNA/RNA ligase family)
MKQEILYLTKRIIREVIRAYTNQLSQEDWNEQAGTFGKFFNWLDIQMELPNT